MSLTERLGRVLPERVLQIIRPIYYGTVGRVYKIGDAYGIIGPDEIYGEQYYQKRKEGQWRTDAQNIAKALDNVFSPASVIDLGCAIGMSLEYFYQNGIEVCGVEGNSMALEHAAIPSEKIDLHDLREPYHPSKQYNLATCFEVAEHIPARFSDELVDSLCRSSNTVVMTAAPPGQVGTHHVNLQPREYWIDKFAERGYTHEKDAVTELREHISVERMEWIEDNLFVFVAEE